MSAPREIGGWAERNNTRRKTGINTKTERNHRHKQQVIPEVINFHWWSETQAAIAVAGCSQGYGSGRRSRGRQGGVGGGVHIRAPEYVRLSSTFETSIPTHLKRRFPLIGNKTSSTFETTLFHPFEGTHTHSRETSVLILVVIQGEA